MRRGLPSSSSLILEAKKKVKLQELAVKFGITATHASRMGIKSLSTCIAAAAFAVA